MAILFLFFLGINLNDSNAQLNSISYEKRYLIDIVVDLGLQKEDLKNATNFDFYVDGEKVLDNSNIEIINKTVSLEKISEFVPQKLHELKLVLQYFRSGDVVYSKMITENELEGVEIVFPKN